MVTRNNPLAGRYFNDPSIAVGLSNLASAFAPPSAEDYLAAEQLRGLRTTNDALSQLYSTANGDVDVLGGILAGGWRPDQGFGAVRSADATARRGQDIDARTAIERARIAAEAGLRSDVLQLGLNPDGSQAADADLLSAITGVPGLPGLPGAQPVAPSETQVLGRNLQEQLGLDPDLATALAANDINATNVVTPEGPRVMPTGRAALAGAEPFIQTGATAAAKPVMLRLADGTTVAASFDPTTGLYKLQDGTPAPPDAVPFNLSSAVGTADEVGATGRVPAAAQNEFLRTQRAATEIDLIAADIERLLDSQPGAAGLVGTFQSAAQNLLQVGREISAAAQQRGVDTPVDLTMLESAAGGGEFNPVFQQIRTFMLRLAYANAQISNPGGEVGQIALARELEALGQGFLGNDESIRAALQVSRQAAAIRRASAETLLGRASGTVTPLAQQNAGVAPPVQLSPEDAALFQKYGVGGN